MINWNKIKVGISNILWWLKVIWNDRQYDFEFIYVIELRKIQRMIKWWSSGEPITEKELILRDLRIIDKTVYNCFVNCAKCKVIS